MTDIKWRRYLQASHSLIFFPLFGVVGMSSEGDDLNFLKAQTYVLKVNIHCDGCKKMVKKQLQKIDGVYAISIDSEQGKVTVSGSVDPEILIKKLRKAGKPAQLLPPIGGNNNINNFFQEQLKKLLLEAGKGQHKDNGKAGADGGGEDHKGQPHQQLQQHTMHKDLKIVEHSLPDDDYDDEKGSELDDDEFYDCEDEYEGEDDNNDDDYDDDELDSIDDFEDDHKHRNMIPMKASDGGGGNGIGHKDHGKNGGEKPATNSNGGKSNPNTISVATNQQQQHAMHQWMTMMNGPMLYGRPMVYGQPIGNPAFGQPTYTNPVSDENVSNCSIM